MYKSANCGQEVTAAQYLAEVMCTRQAQHKNVDLPFKFWNLPKWKKGFMQELFRANALMKLYPEAIVVNTILSNKWLLTLLYKKIDDLLTKEQERVDAINKKADNAPKFADTNVDEAQKKFVPSKGRLSRLKELDEQRDST